jgi:hypothetical protein
MVYTKRLENYCSMTKTTQRCCIIPLLKKSETEVNALPLVVRDRTQIIIVWLSVYISGGRENAGVGILLCM